MEARLTKVYCFFFSFSFYVVSVSYSEFNEVKSIKCWPFSIQVTLCVAHSIHHKQQQRKKYNLIELKLISFLIFCSHKNEKPTFYLWLWNGGADVMCFDGAHIESFKTHELIATASINIYWTHVRNMLNHKYFYCCHLIRHTHTQPHWPFRMDQCSFQIDSFRNEINICKYFDPTFCNPRT